MSEDSIRILETNSDVVDSDTATPVKVQTRVKDKVQGRIKDKGQGRGLSRGRAKSEIKDQTCMQPLLDTIRPRPRSYAQLVDSQGKVNQG